MNAVESPFGLATGHVAVEAYLKAIEKTKARPRRARQRPRKVLHSELKHHEAIGDRIVEDFAQSLRNSSSGNPRISTRTLGKAEYYEKAKASGPTKDSQKIDHTHKGSDLHTSRLSPAGPVIGSVACPWHSQELQPFVEGRDIREDTQVHEVDRNTPRQVQPPLNASARSLRHDGARNHRETEPSDLERKVDKAEKKRPKKKRRLAHRNELPLVLAIDNVQPEEVRKEAFDAVVTSSS
jgi:hypothetical protein